MPITYLQELMPSCLVGGRPGLVASRIMFCSGDFVLFRTCTGVLPPVFGVSRMIFRPGDFVKMNAIRLMVELFHPEDSLGYVLILTNLGFTIGN